jgi:hypothetical protein
MIEICYPEAVNTFAKQFDVSPKELDWHVEAVHGWEAHDHGYAEATLRAVRCLQNGVCT